MARTIPIKPLTSWSFSRYQDYKQCPRKFKLKHIDRIKEPGSEALDRGAAIHELAENYLKGKIARIPKELKTFETEFKKLKQLYKSKVNAMHVEDNWAFTKTWDETQWDNWAHCWVRIKLDCAHLEQDGVLVVTDWKTGKFREEMNEAYVEQLELYALSALLLKPWLKEVRPRLVYLDASMIYPFEDEPLVYTQKDVARLKKLWEKRVAPMFKDKVFAPRPNNKCRWCHYRAANKTNGGGQCEF
jgi:CRISPR/Cas system-associated exonuclease Cas4 (RecB family)